MSDPQSRSASDDHEHGPFIGARHALPFALLIWLALVAVILWRI